MTWGRMTIPSPSVGMPTTSLYEPTTLHNFFTVLPALRYTYTEAPLFRPGLMLGAGFTTTTAGGTTGDIVTDPTFALGGHLYLEFAEVFSFGPEIRYFLVRGNEMTEIAARLLGSIYTHYLLCGLAVNLQF
ncbi:MAG: hypothetical protein A2284_00765 [Deltaproteobacteria bacterium RIFOXYA12_FULL_61_11]|nr:MAG: hypothetical protein A2284_00765 [Deltaproteobacteria bacterium RIFOXYA12_FULL_61_11]